MAFKEGKWYNLGDVNPREHGGVFVRRMGNDIEVVETTNNEDHGGKGYSIQCRDDFVDYLKDKFKAFKKSPDKGQDTAVGRYADWNRFVELEAAGTSLNEIVFYLAADMLSYYGGDSERETWTNYWDMLGIHGITYRNYK